MKHLRRASLSDAASFMGQPKDQEDQIQSIPTTPSLAPIPPDEEHNLGFPGFPIVASPSAQSTFASPSRASFRSHLSDTIIPTHFRPHHHQPTLLKRRPTAVRVLVPDDSDFSFGTIPEPRQRQSKKVKGDGKGSKKDLTERTPLIKPGVKPDIRKSLDDAPAGLDVVRRAKVGLGRMVELGLPLIM